MTGLTGDDVNDKIQTPKPIQLTALSNIVDDNLEQFNLDIDDDLVIEELDRFRNDLETDVIFVKFIFN